MKGYLNGEPIILNGDSKPEELPLGLVVRNPITPIGYEEYQELTEEEKKDKIYLVDDVPTLMYNGEPLGSGGGSSSSNGVVYSLEEKRIGSYLGKPLYRRVVHATTGSANSEGVILSSITDIDVMVSMLGIVQGVSSSYTNLPGLLGYLYYNVDQEAIGCQVRVSDIANRPIDIVLEYTKTSDEAVPDVPVTDPSTSIVTSAVPSGTIVMWSNPEIPDGWVICDGENGTPDLRDRFVISAGKSYSLSNVGGEKEVALTEAQMPRHRHSFSNAITNSVNPSGNSTAVGIGGIAYTSYTGSGQAHNNIPPYYALYFIMKL